MITDTRAGHAYGTSELPNDQKASGRSFGVEEAELVDLVLKSGTLTSTKGTMVRELESQFAAMVGAGFVRGCSSGTAAVHAALAAVDPEPGDEVITTSITDMGAIGPILYQAAIPVFADIDPRTGSVTADTIADRLSERTKAIVVTHLFGYPVPMTDILELAADRSIAVIEDCAQA